jgi:PKD domain
MLRKTLIALFLGLTLLLAACDTTGPDPKRDPSISISPSMNGSIEPGKNGTLTVTLTRTDFDGEIMVGLKNPPAGISATSQSSTGNSVSLMVQTTASTGEGTHALVVSASGDGVKTVEQSVSLEVKNGGETPPPPPPPPPGDKINGPIQNWPKDTSRVLFAYSDQGDILAQQQVGNDGKLDLSLGTPTRQADLDTILNRGGGFCESNSDISSTPKDLPGAFVGMISSDDGSIAVTEQSLPPSGVLIDGELFVFRVYSALQGSVTGSCNFYGSQLEVNAQLRAGWNIVVATYEEDNDSFNLETAQQVPAKAKLWTSAEPQNELPVAMLYISASGYDEAYIDISSSYDPDGSITSYFLDFGDGYSVTLYPGDTLSGYYPYASSGYYTITLTVYDDSGDSSTTSQEVYVYY